MSEDELMKALKKAHGECVAKIRSVVQNKRPLRPRTKKQRHRIIELNAEGMEIERRMRDGR